MSLFFGEEMETRPMLLDGDYGYMSRTFSPYPRYKHLNNYKSSLFLMHECELPGGSSRRLRIAPFYRNHYTLFLNRKEMIICVCRTETTLMHADNDAVIIYDVIKPNSNSSHDCLVGEYCNWKISFDRNITYSARPPPTFSENFQLISSGEWWLFDEGVCLYGTQTYGNRSKALNSRCLTHLIYYELHGDYSHIQYPQQSNLVPQQMKIYTSPTKFPDTNQNHDPSTATPATRSDANCNGNGRNNANTGTVNNTGTNSNVNSNTNPENIGAVPAALQPNAMAPTGNENQPSASTAPTPAPAIAVPAPTPPPIIKNEIVPVTETVPEMRALYVSRTGVPESLMRLMSRPLQPPSYPNGNYPQYQYQQQQQQQQPTQYQQQRQQQQQQQLQQRKARDQMPTIKIILPSLFWFEERRRELDEGRIEYFLAKSNAALEELKHKVPDNWRPSLRRYRNTFAPNGGLVNGVTPTLPTGILNNSIPNLLSQLATTTTTVQHLFAPTGATAPLPSTSQFPTQPLQQPSSLAPQTMLPSNSNL